MTQETVDLINIKYHDLKKQVAKLKEILGEQADAVLGDTEKTLSVYDDMIKTGNKNLDLIISESKVHGKKYGVTIDVMADGSLLDFMDVADIYSLFGNALDNAVECAMNESETDRNIGLNIHLNGEYVCISVTNVCTKLVKIVNGLSVTSKGDSSFHGFGMRSMEYVIKKYNGNMTVDHRDDTFLVKIIVKKRAPEASGQ